MKEIGGVKFDKANDRQSLVELNDVQCVKGEGRTCKRERERKRENYEILCTRTVYNNNKTKRINRCFDSTAQMQLLSLV